MALVGIECGDTRTTVAASAAADSTDPAVSFELGPANFRLTSSDQYGALFTEAFSRLGAQQPPAAVGLAVAGARHAAQHAELEVMAREAMVEVWGVKTVKNIPVRASHDLESAFLAPGPLQASTTRMVCIAGTGSSCYGRTSGGMEVPWRWMGPSPRGWGQRIRVGLRAAAVADHSS